MKNYYQILEISENSSAEVIKAAYKVLAQKYHPDRNKEPQASQYMAAVNEAYSVLSDPERKKQYDEALERGKQKVEPIELMRMPIKNKEGGTSLLEAGEFGIALDEKVIEAKNICGITIELAPNKHDIETLIKIQSLNASESLTVKISTKTNEIPATEAVKLGAALSKIYSSAIAKNIATVIRDHGGYRRIAGIEIHSSGVFLYGLASKTHENLERFDIAFENLEVELFEDKMMVLDKLTRVKLFIPIFGVENIFALADIGSMLRKLPCGNRGSILKKELILKTKQLAENSNKTSETNGAKEFVPVMKSDGDNAPPTNEQIEKYRKVYNKQFDYIDRQKKYALYSFYGCVALIFLGLVTSPPNENSPLNLFFPFSGIFFGAWLLFWIASMGAANPHILASRASGISQKKYEKFKKEIRGE
jgi:hypothetical protein